jgi:putative ABC transport system permease protein
VQGVDRMALISVVAVALLAAVALATTVAAGGRSRSRSLSLLRTLGVQRGFGWVLALAELLPLVVAALVGGALAGAGILVAAGPALGLRLLTGGIGDPSLRVDPATVVLVVAGSLVLCAIAIVADVVAHRRDRPGEVLRVGETT